MGDTVVFDGFAGAAPLAVSLEERPVSEAEAVKVVRVRVGGNEGYTATDLDGQAALALCACLVDKVRDVAPWSEPQSEVAAWLLVLELADGGGPLEDAARRASDRIVAAAVELRRKAEEPDGG
jgi:hypothetical protein